MWASRYWADSYWAPRYWPKVGAASGGDSGDFTITLVPDGACSGDPPDTNDENGACYRVTFGAVELTGVVFGPVERITTPWFGAVERITTPRFGVMRKS